ncbi:AsnC family transcriptional regulator [Streptomyces sp. ODS28]|uniref:Lrp/AsnC family transcriptional regulator n=1 Tax=Streptomyces sp. ODS28 TaxID=3136688 RepID=UPI0031E9B230
MLDEVDRGLVHALHVDGRAPFSRIGEVLGVSPQTVARRCRRLYAEAGLRVLALPDARRAGQSQWIVRFTTTPAAALGLARALARRPDTAWVRLTSGGTEIVAVVTTPPAHPGAPSLLLHDIPRTAGVTGVSAHCLLHTYLGGPSAWPGRISALSAAQERRLREGVPRASTPADDTPVEAPAPGEDELRLWDALARDGRAGYAELARATGWSQATVARRLERLRAEGRLFFDVDIDDVHLGVHTRALLWMTVAPAHLDRTAEALSRHGELAFVAATTGPSNLLAQALCPDPAALHRYLTRRLASLEGITGLETAPVLHTLKFAGPAPEQPENTRRRGRGNR